MKRWTVFFLFVISVFLCLSGCGGTSEASKSDYTVIWDKNVLELYPTTNATGTIRELKNQLVNAGMCQSAKEDTKNMTITFYMTTKQYEEYIQEKRDELNNTFKRCTSDYADEISSIKISDDYQSLEVNIIAKNVSGAADIGKAEIFANSKVLNTIRNYTGLYLAYLNQESCTMQIVDDETSESLFSYSIKPIDSLYNKDNALVPQAG